MTSGVKKDTGRAPAAFMAQAGKGRPKGVQNKTTKLVKEAIAEAFERLGGANRLVEWANEHPDNEKVFYTSLLPKIIPVQTELTGKDGGDIRVNQVNEDASAVRSRLVAGLASLGIGTAPGGTLQ